MRPLQQYHRQNANGMSFRKDVILDVLSQTPCTVQTLMDTCMAMALASQATLHAAIHEMISIGFIQHQVSKLDGRVVFLKVTSRGRKYLEKL